MALDGVISSGRWPDPAPMLSSHLTSHFVKSGAGLPATLPVCTICGAPSMPVLHRDLIRQFCAICDLDILHQKGKIKMSIRMVECARCGEEIPASEAVHSTQHGTRCKACTIPRNAPVVNTSPSETREAELKRLLAYHRYLLQELSLNEAKMKGIIKSLEGLDDSTISVVHYCHCGFECSDYFAMSAHVQDNGGDHFIINKFDEKKRLNPEPLDPIFQRKKGITL